jgi:hypothetical protein
MEAGFDLPLSRQRSLRRLALFCALSMLAWPGETIQGYVLQGPSWPSGSSVTFQLGLGAAGRTLIDGNVSWDTAASPAFSVWDQSIQRIQFANVTTANASANSGDGLNTIVFASTVFGQSFGSGTLAVTYYRYSGSTMSEADILFNVNQNFDSYRGNLRFGSNGYAIGDIRRVLTHELGHALGLKHPDQNGQTVDAIMNSLVSNREVPSADDLSGVQSLYGARAPAVLSVASTSRLPNGHMLLQCAGAPSATNRIEVSTTLGAGSFATLASVNVDGTGAFQFEDVNASGFPQRFYRVAFP